MNSSERNNTYRELIDKLNEVEREKFRKFALDLLKKQKLSELAIKVESQLEATIEHPKFLNMLGDFYQANNCFSQAIYCYELSIKEQPNNYWSNFHLASIYCKCLTAKAPSLLKIDRRNTIERIIELYERILCDRPDDLRTLRALSKFYRHLGRINRAITTNRQIAKLLQPPALAHCTTQSKESLKFLLIGSMKSGTTTLFEAIASHPHFVEPTVKEIQFFSQFFECQEKWFFSHFSSLVEPYFTGEASTSYFDYLQVPERVKASGLDLKFIVILRDPIERIISNFYHLKTYSQLKGKQKLNESIDWQLDRLEPYRDLLVDMASGKQPIDRELPFFQNAYNEFLIVRSLYPIFLKHWLKFFPKEKLLVVKFENFIKEPQQHLREIFDFLAVSPPDKLDYQLHKANQGKHSAERLSPKILERLQAFLSPFNLILKADFQLDFN